MMKNKTYLVTGVAGFIGAAIAKRLIKEGHFVVTIDNLSTGFTSNIPKEVVFIEGDCQDENIINKLINYKFDAIFHVAGQSSGEISFDNPVYDLQTNAQSTLLLLQLALKINCSKFIYASTMSIYGDQDEMPVNEKVILRPKSFYGVGKIASEHYMRIYQEYGINSTALRLFNVYGPGQNLQNLKQGMVSIFIAQAINTKSVHVKGSKLRFRDFVFIDDVVNAFILASERKDFSFKALNISTGVKTSIENLMLIIKKYLPFEFDIKYDGSTPGDQFGITGDKSDAKKELDWQPKVALVEGIEKTCKWALNK
jgi:UDP-glucose 4-epimerase